MTVFSSEFISELKEKLFEVGLIVLCVDYMIKSNTWKYGDCNL